MNRFVFRLCNRAQEQLWYLSQRHKMLACQILHADNAHFSATRSHKKAREENEGKKQTLKNESSCCVILSPVSVLLLSPVGCCPEHKDRDRSAIAPSLLLPLSNWVLNWN